MVCRHCHNEIPAGSNICPLCYSNLAGIKPEEDDQPREYSKKKTKKKHSGRRARRAADRTPMIIAFGLIVLLIVIIALIIRSMFGADLPVAPETPTAAPIVQSQATPEGGFIIFGATSTPVPQAKPTPTPNIEVTPTPAPESDAPTSYNLSTLRKGDQGPNVVTLQQALTELGYLNGATDGNFGTGTQTAVKNFQKDNGLDDDGIAGRKTLEALYSKSSVTPIPETTVAPGDIMDLPG